MASESFPPPALKAVANEVALLLKEAKETVAVAETVGASPSQPQPFVVER